MAQKVTKLAVNEKGELSSAEAELSPLNPQEVRIQVLYSGININDLLFLEGKNRNDFFGTEVVGKVVEVGKDVGHCKVGQVVGVYHPNSNSGEFSTGFASFLQVNQDRVVFIPSSIEPEQAACLISSGTTAFNAL